MIYEKHVSLALSTIFSQVEEIGTPYRTPVRNNNHFIRKAINAHRTKPVFGNVFENKNEMVKINKTFFDFDHKDKRVVEKDVNTTIDNLVERGIREKDIVRGWTTNKGEHLYAKFTPIWVSTKEKNEEGNLIIDEWKWKVRRFQSVMTHGCVSADTSTFGDFGQVARMWGIQRSDNGMTPLAIDKKIKLNDWLREYRTWDARIEMGNEVLLQFGYGSNSIDNFIKESDYIGTSMFSHTELPNIPQIETKAVTNTFNGAYAHMLIPILEKKSSKEFMDRVFDKYADNNTRVGLARSLLEIYGPNNLILICNLMAMLGWINFDWGTTYKHLVNVVRWKK